MGRNLFFCRECASSWRISTSVLLIWIVLRIVFGAVAGFALGLRGAFLVLGIYLIAIPLDALFETLVCYFPIALRHRDSAQCPSCGAKAMSEADFDGHPFACETCGIRLLASINTLDYGAWKRKVLVIIGAGLFVLMVTIQQPVLRNGIAFLFLFLLNDGATALSLCQRPVFTRTSTQMKVSA